MPVLGAAAFIAAGEVGDETGVDGGVGGGAGGPGGVLSAVARVLAHPALQYVGDLSYSLYLAHWPVVVLYPYRAGRPVEEVGLAGGGRIVLIAWALAHACKRGWEDRFRQAGGGSGGGGAAGADSRQALPCATADVEVWLPELVGHDHGAAAAAAAAAAATKKHLAQTALKPGPPWSASARSRSLASAAWMAGMLAVATLVTAGSLGTVAPRHAPGGADDGASGATIRGSSTYPGAEAVVRDAPSTHAFTQLQYSEVQPPVHVALLDKGPVYDSTGGVQCPLSARDKYVKVCTTAPAASNVTGPARPPPPQVVLLGDSHAAHWFPALTAAAKIHGWTATSVLKNGCMPMNASAVGVKAAGPTWPACQAWFLRAVQWVLAEKPAAVIFCSASHYKTGGSLAESHARQASGVVAVAQQIRAQGVPVLAIKHTPLLKLAAPVCLESAERRGEDIQEAMAACSAAASDALPDERALNLAARQMPGLHLLNFDDAFADSSGQCPPVIGNVVVYRDQHHLTSSYSKTLGPALGRRLIAAVPGLAEVA